MSDSVLSLDAATEAAQEAAADEAARQALPKPIEQYGDTMECPITGLHIPKTLAANVAWRKKLINAAKTSGTLRRQLTTASAQSPIVWLNAFGWTFLQKKVGVDGKEIAVHGESSHIPFITWAVQDKAILELHDAIVKGSDALISKSRDMGASWLIVALFQWFWQFRPSSTFLELSRKESLVDRRGDMDSLFEKHRYLLRMQPHWLQPRSVRDNRLHFENQDIGTTIEGESTNKDAGQASRKTAILLDEFARVEDGDEIDLATADTSACRIFNSTPGGPNTHFTRVFRGMQTGVRSGKLIIMPWWDHPDKSRGLYPVKEDDTWRWSSPWRDHEAARRSKRNLAQNIDMEHGRAGDVFFSAEEIEAHRTDHERDPDLTGNILYDDEITDASMRSITRKRDVDKLVWSDLGTFHPWRLWTKLIDNRPDQNTRYVIGVDISGGTGASNSVLTVLDHRTGRIVAKWWDANTSPEELARVTSAAGVWFGGRNLPLVVFEKNGPGGIYGRKLLDLGYPNIWHQRVESTKANTRTPRWGWHSSPARKEMVLGAYRDAIKQATIINPCKEALDEALDYVYDDKGRIEPGSLGSEEGGGHALHGDHVISDALCVLGRKDLPKLDVDAEVRPVSGSFADRKRQWKHKQKQSKAVWSDR